MRLNISRVSRPLLLGREPPASGSTLLRSRKRHYSEATATDQNFFPGGSGGIKCWSLEPDHFEIDHRAAKSMVILYA